MIRKYSFLVLLLPVLGFGQGTVNVNILELYGQVPAPQEAYSRAECTVNGDVYLCDTKNYYKQICFLFLLASLLR